MNTKMTEETFAYLVLAFLMTLGFANGFLVVFLPQIDRLVERWKKKHS